MQELRFQVYGTRLAVVRAGTGWQAFVRGPDGKRRSASITEVAVTRRWTA